VVIISEHLNKNHNICVKIKHKLAVYVSFLAFSVLKVCLESLRNVFCLFRYSVWFQEWLRFFPCYLMPSNQLSTNIVAVCTERHADS